MLRIVWLILLYFALVFGAGFILGPIRVLMLEPHLRSRSAELLEMPIMLLVIWAAAHWLARRFTQHLSTKAQLSIGVLAVLGILAADTAVGVFLRKMTIMEVFLHRDVVASLAYYGLLLLCALMPWLQARNSERSMG